MILGVPVIGMSTSLACIPSVEVYRSGGSALAAVFTAATVATAAAGGYCGQGEPGWFNPEQQPLIWVD